MTWRQKSHRWMASPWDREGQEGPARKMKGGRFEDGRKRWGMGTPFPSLRPSFFLPFPQHSFLLTPRFPPLFASCSQNWKQREVNRAVRSFRPVRS